MHLLHVCVVVVYLLLVCMAVCLCVSSPACMCASVMYMFVCESSSCVSLLMSSCVRVCEHERPLLGEVGQCSPV